MDRASLGELYRSESRDYLDALGRAILALERGEGRDAVDEAFRVVHTLKGMSAAMGYQAVATLAHGVEHMLERVVREEGRVFPRRGTMLREEVLGEGSTGLERTLPKQC